MVLGLLAHVTPSIFWSRILRNEALVYNSYFSGQPFYGNYLTLDSHTKTLISHAFAYSSRCSVENRDKVYAVVSWVVDTWNLQLTCKNAVINAVVSWVVDTWNLQLTCKNAVISAVVPIEGIILNYFNTLFNICAINSFLIVCCCFFSLLQRPV